MADYRFRKMRVTDGDAVNIPDEAHRFRYLMDGGRVYVCWLEEVD